MRRLLRPSTPRRALLCILIVGLAGSCGGAGGEAPDEEEGSSKIRVRSEEDQARFEAGEEAARKRAETFDVDELRERIEPYIAGVNDRDAGRVRPVLSGQALDGCPGGLDRALERMEEDDLAFSIDDVEVLMVYESTLIADISYAVRSAATGEPIDEDQVESATFRLTDDGWMLVLVFPQDLYAACA